MLAVGLMSGTSLDGIDASLVEIEGYGEETKIHVINSISIPYGASMKERLLEMMNVETSDVEKLCSMNYEISYLFADAVKEVCQASGIPLEELDLIGSHGQTVYHLPRANAPFVRSTLQIGDPAIIAYETNTLVVSNFRAMDMAAGGEGAPLIPYIDWLLFKSNEKGRILQNIGGIGNCTVLKRNGQKEEMIAFDTGPGNMIIDELCRTLKHIPYDENGVLAASGTIHHDLVQEWMEHDYFKKHPPKSTGREVFGKDYTLEIIKKYPDLSAEDLIATATYFTAYSIVAAYRDFVFPKYEIDEIIISGGGGNNPTLCKMIQELLPEKKVMIIDELGISTNEKEAVGFAILAHEYIHQQKTNIPQATGANEAVLLGQMTLPPHGDHKRVLVRAMMK